MNAGARLNAIGFCAAAELARREKPARLSLKTQGSKAALAAHHAGGLLDCISDAPLREVAALALAALEYVHTATAAMQRAQEAAELLAAAQGTDEAAA